MNLTFIRNISYQVISLPFKEEKCVTFLRQIILFIQKILHFSSKKFKTVRLKFQFDSSVVANDSTELETERQRSAQLEHELVALKIKYDDVCERVTAATIQLERVQVVLEQTLRRCDQLEKEKVCTFISIDLKLCFQSMSTFANILFYDSTSSATQEIGINFLFETLSSTRNTCIL